MRSQIITWILAGCVLLGPSMLADTREPAVGQAPAELDALAKAFRAARHDFTEKADFGPAAVDQWRGTLKSLRGRLDALPRAKWSVTDQVDWYLLLAEMNQADFDVRVLRPWARDPRFYVSLVAGRLGETDKLTPERAARLTKQLQAAPGLLEKARNLLTDATRWHAEVALHDIEAPQDPAEVQTRYQGPVTALRLLEKNAANNPELAQAAKDAADAVVNFGGWIRRNSSKMAAKGNIGLDNYNWYLRNVHLSEYDAAQALILAQRDYERNMANLAFHENMNRSLPPLERATSAEEYYERDKAGEQRARRWLTEDNILTLQTKDVPEYFWPGVRWQEHLDWWTDTLFHEPMVDKVHAGVPGHQYDSLIVSRHHRPIRAGFTASRMWGEGWGFYLEELGLQTRLLADRPRSKEIFDLWQAYRYHRVLFEIKAASGELSPSDIVAFQLKMMPLMRENDSTAWMEAAITLGRPQQIQYVLGKYQLEGFVARERLRLGDKFDLREFHDRLFRAGPIPVALSEWEISGNDEILRKLKLTAPSPNSPQ
jgi:Bacterial protein of unknown function (DUF885)